MEEIFAKQLKNPPQKFRPIPFWSWNEKLDTDETARQIGLMSEAGLGGYFMHARGGLQTKYMSDEWFDNIKTGITVGKEHEMEAWGYDENGWPSGFGNGEVTALGINYQQKYLRCKEMDKKTEVENLITITEYNGKFYHLFFDVNEFYVDTLDSEVTAKFIEAVHERYKERLGEDFAKMAGFFTDEPQISRNGTPWSLTLPRKYKERYGEELLPILTELFYPLGEFKRTRVRFWSLVRDLFADNYMKPIYDWCKKNNVRFTGHMVLEETLTSQLASNGACMPCYEFLDIPGMDWLTRSKVDRATPLQLASVAHQLDKKQILSETFALTGWNVSFDELKWLYEQQMVRGINLLCQHLEGYSLRGIRKRDYPPSLFYQQPWFAEYKQFNDAMSRIGMLLSKGRVAYDVLLLHPQSSAWICYDDSENNGIKQLEEDFEKAMEVLENNQIPFHLGDERIIERHGSCKGASLVVGTQSYSVVIVPACSNISSNLLNLLQAYVQNGGKLIFCNTTPSYVDGVPNDEICKLAKSCKKVAVGALAEEIPLDINRVIFSEKSGDNTDIFATVRELDDENCKLYYIVNSSTAEKNIHLDLNFTGTVAKKLDYFTGELLDFDTSATVKLEEMGSVMIFVYPKPELFNGDWSIKQMDENAIVLDYCRCSFDGKVVGERVHINNVQEMACAYNKPVDIELLFEIDVLLVPKKSPFLVLETPENFMIELNGKAIESKPCGFYFDKEFKKIAIGNSLKVGCNQLKLTTSFSQTAEVYENIKNSNKFESEKNKLSYCDEIEAIYLVGDFGVKTSGVFTKSTRNAVIYDGGFAVTSRAENVKLGSIVEQGFPFFAGSITLQKKLTVGAQELKNCSITLDNHGFTVAKITVNGTLISTMLWAPYTADISLVEGENTVEIELIGNLRNLLGPHHLKNGESYVVAPSNFFQNSPLWTGGLNKNWSDNYCFVQFGLGLK